MVVEKGKDQKESRGLGSTYEKLKTGGREARKVCFREKLEKSGKRGVKVQKKIGLWLGEHE